MVHMGVEGSQSQEELLPSKSIQPGGGVTLLLGHSVTCDEEAEPASNLQLPDPTACAATPSEALLPLPSGAFSPFQHTRT
jgi:hypothetical protein